MLGYWIFPASDRIQKELNEIYVRKVEEVLWRPNNFFLDVFVFLTKRHPFHIVYIHSILIHVPTCILQWFFSETERQHLVTHTLQNWKGWHPVHPWQEICADFFWSVAMVFLSQQNTQRKQAGKTSCENLSCRFPFLLLHVYCTRTHTHPSNSTEPLTRAENEKRNRVSKKLCIFCGVTNSDCVRHTEPSKRHIQSESLCRAILQTPAFSIMLSVLCVKKLQQSEVIEFAEAESTDLVWAESDDHRAQLQANFQTLLSLKPKGEPSQKATDGIKTHTRFRSLFYFCCVWMRGKTQTLNNLKDSHKNTRRTRLAWETKHAKDDILQTHLAATGICQVPHR